LTTFDTDGYDNIYQAVDCSGTGKLTKEDLRKSFDTFLEESLADTELASLFQDLDINCSKYVEYKEWLAAALPEDILLSEENLKKAFAAFDKDGDGDISAQDLKQVLGFFLDISDDRMDHYIQEKILKQVQTGEDSKITYDVFVKTLRETKNGPKRDLSAVKTETQKEEDPAIDTRSLFDRCKAAFERSGRDN
jgi:Ca2+-binding EF-hand superfamily protein